MPFEFCIMYLREPGRSIVRENTELAKKYLEAAKTAANRVMSAQKYKNF